jgi:hypothetical protein
MSTTPSEPTDRRRDTVTNSTGNSLDEPAPTPDQRRVIQQARIVQAAIALVEAFPERREEWLELVDAVQAYTGVSGDAYVRTVPPGSPVPPWPPVTIRIE